MNAHYALAVILIALPHLIGAPHLDTYYGYAPPEVGSLFVARSLGVAAIAWLSLGYFAGALWERG
jgi:predicted cobalt transporter CbtA